MINMESCHQLMPLPYNIFTTEGLSLGRAIYLILSKPNLISYLFSFFWKYDEGTNLTTDK